MEGLTVPLVLEFKDGDKLIINGAVIENSGTHTKLIVHNQAAILREKEILSAEDAQTPASRVYFALQCAYVFPTKAAEYEDKFSDFIEEYLAACPSAAPIAKKIIEQMRAGNLYRALKEAQKMIDHESSLVEGLEHDMEDIVEAKAEESGQDKK